MGRDNSVRITTRYGLDVPGIESRWGVRYSASVQTGLGAHVASYTMCTWFFPGGKAAGAWRWLPTTSTAEVKERVQLYFYSPFWPSWTVLGWKLPLLLSGCGEAQLKWCYRIIGASSNNFANLLSSFSFYKRKLSSDMVHTLCFMKVKNYPWKSFVLFLLQGRNCFWNYSKTCLKRKAIVPVFFPRFHRFPFYKGLCFNKTKYKKYDRLGLQWSKNLK